MEDLSLTYLKSSIDKYKSIIKQLKMTLEKDKNEEKLLKNKLDALRSRKDIVIKEITKYDDAVNQYGSLIENGEKSYQKLLENTEGLTNTIYRNTISKNK